MRCKAHSRPFGRACGLATHMPASTSFLWASYVLTVGKRELAWEGRVRVKENPSGLGWGLVATTAGLEPVTSAVTGRRSNQLSYAAIATLFPRYVPPERVELSLSD